jgi:hypothetical protein
MLHLRRINTAQDELPVSVQEYSTSACYYSCATAVVLYALKVAIL